mmetsp:Transcript_116937/g.342445  ORF Transcript_116937/g.342445 Transcript_116937/m.342445 type:complete len:420 (-) Transcript_116937:726-1985(-)
MPAASPDLQQLLLQRLQPLPALRQQIQQPLLEGLLLGRHAGPRWIRQDVPGPVDLKCHLVPVPLRPRAPHAAGPTVPRGHGVLPVEVHGHGELAGPALARQAREVTARQQLQPQPALGQFHRALGVLRRPPAHGALQLGVRVLEGLVVEVVAVEAHPQGAVHRLVRIQRHRQGAEAMHFVLAPVVCHLEEVDAHDGAGGVRGPLELQGHQALVLQLLAELGLDELLLPGLLEGRRDLADGQDEDQPPEHTDDRDDEAALPGLRNSFASSEAAVHVDHACDDPPERMGNIFEDHLLVSHVPLALEDDGPGDEGGHQDVEDQHEDGLLALPQGLPQRHQHPAEGAPLHDAHDAEQPKDAQEAQGDVGPVEELVPPEGKDGQQVHQVRPSGEEQPQAHPGCGVHCHGLRRLKRLWVNQDMLQ